MSDDQATHPGHRSHRLKFCDYASPGFYFVTICAHERKQIFSRIENGEIDPTTLGLITIETWQTIPTHFPTVNLHSFVAMPNHVHGILEIVSQIPKQKSLQISHPRTAQVDPGSLAAIIRSYKSEVTRRTHADLHWANKIWQRNYYERVLRDSKDIKEATLYIADNPLQWQWDQENPNRAYSLPPSQTGRSVLRPCEDGSDR